MVSQVFRLGRPTHLLLLQRGNNDNLLPLLSIRIFFFCPFFRQKLLSLDLKSKGSSGQRPNYCTVTHHTVQMSVRFRLLCNLYTKHTVRVTVLGNCLNDSHPHDRTMLQNTNRSGPESVHSVSVHFCTFSTLFKFLDFNCKLESGFLATFSRTRRIRNVAKHKQVCPGIGIR